MELLNNFWTLLTTPNEAITRLFTAPFSFLEMYLYMNIFIALLKIETNNKTKLAFLLSTTIIGLIISYLIPNPYNVFLNYFTCFILIFFIFKLSLFKTLISIVSCVSIFAIIGTLVLNPLLTILNITTNELTNIPIYNLIYSITIYIIIYLIILLLKYRNLKITLYDDLDKKNKYIILLNFILGIITLTLQAYILFYYVDTLPILITFLSFISLIAYFGISIYSLKNAMNLSVTTKKLESAEEYNRTLRILHDSVRGFKHDFDNIVTTIGGYIAINDMKGLEKYYLQLAEDCQKVNILYLLNPETINNPGIYNLLTQKYNEAMSKNIKTNLTFLLDLSTLKMEIYEFARILGILLDNAIEASCECDEKIINITFRDDSKHSRQLITIENTYKNKDVDTEKIFEKGISGKENHTGLGLWEVRKIIKKYNNINLYTSKTEKLFSQQLEIYY